MTLHGQGATKERLEKSNIVKKITGTTRGGIPNSYAHMDTEHCALDVMLQKGFIENDHYDAGYDLRKLYYKFTSTGRWIDEGGKAHEGDFETDIDVAMAKYNRALGSIEKRYRAVTRTVCIEDTVVPANYELIKSIQYGLEDLIKFFKHEKKSCKHF